MTFGLLHLGLLLCGGAIGWHGIKNPVTWIGIAGLMLIATSV